jgi:hypothetical protein
MDIEYHQEYHEFSPITLRLGIDSTISCRLGCVEGMVAELGKRGLWHGLANINLDFRRLFIKPSSFWSYLVQYNAQSRLTAGATVAKLATLTRHTMLVVSLLPIRGKQIPRMLLTGPHTAFMRAHRDARCD